MEYPTPGFRASHRRLAAENLKRCPLCGALNADLNDECFVCTWQGVFDHDEDSVCEALDYLIERCPDLAVDLAPEVKPNMIERAKRWLVARIVRSIGH
jgi:hypothetical protein